jgi:hypothetical protein
VDVVDSQVYHVYPVVPTYVMRRRIHATRRRIHVMRRRIHVCHHVYPIVPAPIFRVQRSRFRV